MGWRSNRQQWKTTDATSMWKYNIYCKSITLGINTPLLHGMFASKLIFSVNVIGLAIARGWCRHHKAIQVCYQTKNALGEEYAKFTDLASLPNVIGENLLMFSSSLSFPSLFYPQISLLVYFDVLFMPCLFCAKFSSRAIECARWQ